MQECTSSLILGGAQPRCNPPSFNAGLSTAASFSTSCLLLDLDAVQCHIRTVQYQPILKPLRLLDLNAVQCHTRAVQCQPILKPLPCQCNALNDTASASFTSL
eukprot:TRINITY_DN12644_c3_g2_i2.p4 TRINITY_DN12644_c3_g2~~TRINITY_DN12644_c3_g2_i2.p4  ORF type:complete len:103 (-),score=2.94 TRINITY_DN12644_c3_g2_i2:115-423(-)